MCIQRSRVMRFINVKTRYITLLFFKKNCGQFYPVKRISVFIDFKHGEFFLLQVYLKLLCFSSYWVSKQVKLLQLEAEESWEKSFHDGEKSESFCRGRQPLWPMWKWEKWEKRHVRCLTLGRKSLNVLMKWMFLYNGLKLFWKHFK